jgi:hypothetical protein
MPVMSARSEDFRPLVPARSRFVTRLLPGSAPTAARLEVLRGGKDELMSVREAAQQLGRRTATVVWLGAAGALPHIRLYSGRALRRAGFW